MPELRNRSEVRSDSSRGESCGQAHYEFHAKTEIRDVQVSDIHARGKRSQRRFRTDREWCRPRPWTRGKTWRPGALENKFYFSIHDPILSPISQSVIAKRISHKGMMRRYGIRVHTRKVDVSVKSWNGIAMIYLSLTSWIHKHIYKDAVVAMHAKSQIRCAYEADWRDQ